MIDFIYNVAPRYTGNRHYYRTISELTKVEQQAKHVFLVNYTIKCTTVGNIIHEFRLKANIDIRTDAYIYYKDKIYKNLEELSKLSIIVENEQLTKTIDNL